MAKNDFSPKTFLHALWFVSLVLTAFLITVGARVEVASAQTEKGGEKDGQVVINQVDVSNFPNVVLYVSVSDASGKLNLGLGPEDFLVKEDEVEQSPLNVKTQLPSIATVLVVDSSGSMKNAMADTQRAATVYVDNVRKEDEIAVIWFADSVKVAQQFTTDKPAVRNAIRALKARGNTALYDALYEATKTFGERKGRKVIILLTDGKDDDGTNRPLSVKTMEQGIAAANEVNVPIFAIGLGTSVDEGILRKIGEQTGGKYFRSPSSSDLENLYKEIGALLEGQYIISYTTNLAEPDGSWHRVVLSARQGLGQKQYKAPLEKTAAAPPSQQPPVKGAAEAKAAAGEKPRINVLAASQGTKVLYATSQYNSGEWAAKNLMDEAIGSGHEYSSQAVTPSQITPQEIVFELAKSASISEIVADPYSTENRKKWAKDCELWVSTTGPYEGFTKVLDFKLDNTAPESQDPAYSLTEQSFPLAPTEARWIKLLLKSNYGGDYIQMGEIKLMGYYSEEEAAPEKLKNVIAAENGGKLISYTSQYDDTGWAARNLIDGQLGDGHQYATQAGKPGEILFVLPAAMKIKQLAFNPFTTESPKKWAKEVEVEVSTEGPRQGFKSVGKFTLHNRQNIDPNLPLPDQAFKIDPVDAKFIKLKLLSSHGGEYIEMGEFKVLAATE